MATEVAEDALLDHRLHVGDVIGRQVIGLVKLDLAVVGLVEHAVEHDEVVMRGRRELGIRMALGASRTRIERDVVAGGVGMASLGVILGLGGSWGLGRFLEDRLWGVEAGDLTTLAGAALLLLATAAIASWLPARRAGRIDPVQTLRVE
jgi:hypothetical protein